MQHYAATLEPDIAAKSIKGTVRIRFSTDSQDAEFNCGDLTIDSVRLAGTALNRTLVYDKGAYVLHLLREEMGERAFWNGLRLFTRRHFGKSVVTSDFVNAMEEANGKSLKEFFAKWVYLGQRGT